MILCKDREILYEKKKKYNDMIMMGEEDEGKSADWVDYTMTPTLPSPFYLCYSNAQNKGCQQ
jgi:hypothetical protein